MSTVAWCEEEQPAVQEHRVVPAVISPAGAGSPTADYRPLSPTRGRWRTGDDGGIAGHAAAQRRRRCRNPTTPPRAQVNPRAVWSGETNLVLKQGACPRRAMASDPCPLSCALPPSCRLCQRCSAWLPSRARGMNRGPGWVAGGSCGVADRGQPRVVSIVSQVRLTRHAGCSSSGRSPGVAKTAGQRLARAHRSSTGVRGAAVFIWRMPVHGSSCPLSHGGVWCEPRSLVPADRDVQVDAPPRHTLRGCTSTVDAVTPPRDRGLMSGGRPNEVTSGMDGVAKQGESGSEPSHHVRSIRPTPGRLRGMAPAPGAFER